MGKKSNTARFPVARIKKLIQADEDVGKVAQGTPIVVSKALELFLKTLVEACVADATERGSKKVTAYNLKRTIKNGATFDFCSDIVADVADPITAEDGSEKPKRAPRKKAVKKVVDAKAEEDEDEGGMEVEVEDAEEADSKPVKADSEDYEE